MAILECTVSQQRKYNRRFDPMLYNCNCSGNSGGTGGCGGGGVATV